MGKFDNFYSNLIVTLNYLKSDLIKKQRSFKIGLVSIFMVVFFLTLLLNAIQLCSSIFIKLSEQQSGEIDLILTPYLMSRNVETKKSGFDTFYYNKTTTPSSNISIFDISSLNFLNFYEIKERLENLSYIEGVAPRWMIVGKVASENKAKNISNEFSANIFILDSTEENNIGIGRGLNLPELQKNECYVSKTLRDALKLDIGDTIQMDIKLSDLLEAFRGDNSNQEQDDGDSEPYGPDDQDNKNKEVNSNKQYTFQEQQNLNEYPNNDYENDDLGGYNINESYFGYYNNELNLENIIKNRKIKNKFKTILKFGPIKELINSFLNEYINNNINNFKELLMKIIQKANSDNSVTNDLSFISFKKNYLDNSFIKDESFVKKIINILFQKENEENKSQQKLENIILKSIISQIISYNETSDNYFR